MKTSLLLTQKVKVAALLFLVMAFVVLFSLRVDNQAHHMDDAVTTVYKDRLQPALIIVYLSEKLHAKRNLAQIQSEIGREIVQGAHRDAAGVSVITALTIAVAVIIGILIQSLVHNARFLDRNPSKIHFN